MYGNSFPPRRRKPMYKEGTRIRLVRCNDQYTKLDPGEKGTIRFIDDLGTVHVDWDCGSSLGLCVDDGDQFELL